MPEMEFRRAQPIRPMKPIAPAPNPNHASRITNHESPIPANPFPPLAVVSPTLYDTATFVKPLTSYTCKLTDPQAAALRAWLQAHNYRFREVPYARFAAEKEKTNVVFYESGKLVVQGKGTQEFVEFVLEPEIVQEARLGYEAVLNPDLLLPRLGVDESGKGDFFGPLCVAGAYVNESVVKAWTGVGIRDSKNISSDKRSEEHTSELQS